MLFQTSFVWGQDGNCMFAEAQWIAMEADCADLHIVPGLHLRSGVRRVYGDQKLPTYRLPLLRKDFRTQKGIKRAVAYVCGLGHFDLFVNGQKVGGHFLDCGWTLYSKEALYETFDVTSMLQRGDNAIGVMLGNGFYNIPHDRYFKVLTSFGAPKLLLRLEISYKDGSHEEICSDTSWKVSPSPITFSSIYGGEDFDAALAQTNWAKPHFDDSNWKQALPTTYEGRLLPQQAEPLRVAKRLPTKHIFQNQKGQWVYDLGQNFSGIIDVRLSSDRRQAVRFRPAELLNADSTVNQRASGSPYFLTYTTPFTEQEANWHPQFTYYGFRYVQIEDAVPEGKPNPDGLPVIKELTGLHTTAATIPVGHFTCSDTLFNRIYDLIDWAIRSNVASVITDCPHREKLGWLEQDYLMQASLLYCYDLSGLYAKLMQDMASSQWDSGCIPTIAPEYVRFSDGFEDTPEWGSAFIQIPWNIWKVYGDENLIRRYYPDMKRYVAYLLSRAKGHILSYGLGDWFDIGSNAPGKAQLTSNSLTATATYYHDVYLLSQMAGMIGEETDRNYYQQLATDIKNAFRQRFFHGDAHVENDSQTGLAMTLSLGLADSTEQPKVLQHLVDDITQRNYALTAGDVGYRYVLDALSRGGRSDIVFKMNCRRDVPGYAWQLDHGATALTESWQAYPNVSNNHLMLGHLMEWFYAWLGGIRQQSGSTGFRKILIDPQTVGPVSWTETSWQSPQGIIACRWDRTETQFTLQVTIPKGTTAKVILPVSDKHHVKIAKGKRGVLSMTETDNHVEVEVKEGNYKFLASLTQVYSGNIYVAPDGDDSAAGTIDAPLATLPAAYKKVAAGDTVWFRGGMYSITDEQVMKKDRLYAYVFALERGGTATKRTCFMGYPGERPVFDFSALQLDGKYRIAAFYLGADYLHLRNFDIVGVPVRMKGHTQSECVAARKGSHCIVENIAMHDNMAIGYYQNAGSYNMVLNCDAYNNYDDFSEGAYGGNVDGFGCHVLHTTDVGNVFRGCRAWRNSDDGYDLIHCQAAVEIDHCLAMYNGFRPTINPQDTTIFKSAGDGNGFKAGGWGMKPQIAKSPVVCPQHYVHHCIAYHNKANGFYSNHHLGGNLWKFNTSVQNQRDNYNMVNRQSATAYGNIDVDGYGHVLIGNVSWNPKRLHLSNCDANQCTLTDNSFAPTQTSVTASDFISTAPILMFVSRDIDGNLPKTGFLVAKKDSQIAPSALNERLFNEYWRIESEAPNYQVSFQGDTCEFFAPKGLTLWRKEKLQRGMTVEYDALVMDDRLSDMNCFWLASDPRTGDIWTRANWRSGIFSRCYTLQMYYLGYGGNHNTTTRFRRYDGDEASVEDKSRRPAILKEYTDTAHLLKSDHWYHVKIESTPNGRTRFFIDGECIVDYADPIPLESGWFGFRTTLSRTRITNFKMY